MPRQRRQVVVCYCPECKIRLYAQHYSVLGFTFPGEERVDALISWLRTHPEYTASFEQKDEEALPLPRH